MYTSISLRLCLLPLICQQVSSSRNFLSQNETFISENFDSLVEQFFVDLNKVYLIEYMPRHVMVVGASANELQQTRALFESYPYVICEQTEKCVYSQRFSQRSIVVVFLGGLSKETLIKNVENLSLCRKCMVLFVSNGIIMASDIRFILTLAIQHVPYSEFANIRENVIELYASFPTANCSLEIRLASVWRPGMSSDNIKIWASRSRNMNGCPVSVSSLLFTPKMIIKESENGSLTILGGREGKLVLTLAKRLNFTLALRSPSMEDQLKYSRKEAIRNDVASGISEIGIGRLRPTNCLNNSVAISFPYDEECVTWGVPRIMNWSNDIVWVEFSWEVWSLVGLVFTVGCIVRYTYRNIVTSKNDEEKNLGLVIILLDAVAMHLGNPIGYVSSFTGGRFMLIASLYYAMVITTAYKTSLASILATDEGTPQIVDVQGIINANLKVGGSLYDYNILKDQVNDSELTSKILKRFVSNNNDLQSWDQLKFDHDYAYLSRRSSLTYLRQLFFKAHESVTYDILNGCVLAYHTVMVFQKKSFLREPVDNIILRLVESGILRHWDIDEFDADTLLKRKSAKKYFEERATNKFLNIFILYAFCILICLVTFVVELFMKWFESRE